MACIITSFNQIEYVAHCSNFEIYLLIHSNEFDVTLDINWRFFFVGFHGFIVKMWLVADEKNLCLTEMTFVFPLSF